MNRPFVARLPRSIWPTLVLASLLAFPASAAPPAKSGPGLAGQFFTVPEPITSDVVRQLEESTTQFIKQSALKGEEAVLVFEFRPSDSAGTPTGYGTALELAELISQRLSGAKLTVAFVPKPLKGYALLPALACDEMVMGKDATIGPITPEGHKPNPAVREAVRQIALNEVKDEGLLLGMFDPQADLRAVKTSDQHVHFVPREKLAEFRTKQQVESDAPAWEGSVRGQLSAERAREQGICKRFAETQGEVATAYELPGGWSADDPTLGQEVRPVWIQIQGPIDTVKRAYLGRRLEQARQERVNLIFFQINSEGGIDTAADGIADALAGVKDIKTVAYVDDRAVGVAALVALSCNDIVLGKKAVLGNVQQLITGDGQAEKLDEAHVKALAGRAANIAAQRGHPPAVARKMVDPKAVLVRARDSFTSAPCWVLQSEIDPARHLAPEVDKPAGDVLTVTGEEAVTYGLGRVVADEEELKALYGLRGKSIRVDGPTWVDSVVSVLTDPFVSWFLLFIGLFMLVLELKLPGIGLPAITSALAFVLFFWSHYLSGTADQLEIILFLVGMVCLGLELFVFPGFGVFGMSGVLLVLTSIVLASHTFAWPTQEYEYREMGHTLLRVLIAMGVVFAAAALVARFFPSLPLLNRLVLKAEQWTGDVTGGEGSSGMEYDPLGFLIGETGRTTTVLRPSGKARFGDRLLDVTAGGAFIEPDSLVEVIDVQGPRVIVKRVDL